VPTANKSSLRLVTSHDESDSTTSDFGWASAARSDTNLGSSGSTLAPWHGIGSSVATATLQQVGQGLVFVHPLFVQLEQLGGEWFATSTDLALVGRGETQFDALDELRAMVAELHEALTEMRESLGPHLQGQLHFLERLEGRR